MSSLIQKVGAAYVATLYRSFLRSAKAFDARPELRCAFNLLAEQAQQAPNEQTTRPIPLFAPPHGVTDANTLKIAENVSETIVSCLREYSPSLYSYSSSHSHQSFLKHVVKSVRYSISGQAAGLDAILNATILFRMIAEEVKPLDTPPSISRFSKLSATDTLTPGILMATHPSIIAPGHSVAYIYDISKNVQEIHKNEDWMLRTYVINRPLYATVGEMFKRTDLGSFGDLQLFFGGRSSSNLAVMHRVPGIEGAAAVDESETLFIGGNIQAINDALDKGTASPDDFKVVLGSHDIKLVGDDDNSLAMSDEDDQYLLVQGEDVPNITLLPVHTPTQTDATSPTSIIYHQDEVWRQCLHRYEIGGVAKAADASLGGFQALAARLPVSIALPFSLAVREAAAAKANTTPTKLV